MAKQDPPIAADPAPVVPVNPLVAADNIPSVEDVAIPIGSVEFTRPAISEYKGRYARVDNPDGEQYALAIKEDAPEGKTHFLLNEKNFDNVTKDEFKAKYDKK